MAAELKLADDAVDSVQKQQHMQQLQADNDGEVMVLCFAIENDTFGDPMHPELTSIKMFPSVRAAMAGSDAWTDSTPSQSVLHSFSAKDFHLLAHLRTDYAHGAHAESVVLRRKKN